jgi:hypothetical protein
MPERTAEDIRREIAAERQRLTDELDVLHAEARSLVPVAVAGVVGLVLLSQHRRITGGVRFLWRLV